MVAEYGKGAGAAENAQITVTVPEAMRQELDAQLPAMFQESLRGSHPLIEGSDRLEGFTFSVGDTGEVTLTPDTIVEALKPFVLDKFYALLEGAGEDAAG